MCHSFAEMIGYPHKMEFIDLVVVAELSVVGVGYAAVVETVVGLTTVIEAIRPGVAELERVFDTL